MNRTVSQAKWKQIRGKIKERWGKLTDNEITVMNGEIDQLVGKIQERYGLAREEVENDVRQWYEKHITQRKRP